MTTELHRRTSTGTPFLSWCLIVRNAEATLEACLQSLRERTPDAELVIVDTCSSDSTPEIAKKYADVFETYKGPRGDWDTEMLWFDDAAAARQRSFELASGKWRAWADADDRVVGPDEAKKLLTINKQICPPNPSGTVVGDPNAAPKTLIDVLKDLEKLNPQADCVWAPYLYQRDENGHAIVWQERERIVRWKPGRWRWAEKAHEILVPNGPFPPRIVFSHLLFVHEKKFTKDDQMYSLMRHYDVLVKMYEAGDRTTRRCTYLAEYAKAVDPRREDEFVEAAHTYAVTTLDRYRALILRGSFFAARGLFNDALEAFGSATALHPEIPDAWFTGANFFSRVNDISRAVQWYEKGLVCPPPASNPNSFISPRSFAMEFPTRHAIELHKMAKALTAMGQHDVAVNFYEKAVKIMANVACDPDVGIDAAEARTMLIRFDNDLKAQRYAMMLRDQVNYLFDNDEPLKAAVLVETAPWNLQDHPLVLDLELKVKPVIEHVTSPKKYSDFYQSTIETGAVDSPEEWLRPEKCVSRARWVAEWIQKNKPNARVLEIGPFDGIVAIPLLRMCPDIEYVGVELSKEAVDRLRLRLKEMQLDSKVRLVQGTLGEFQPWGEEAQVEKAIGKFDVIIWFEVIEHVPSPTDSLSEMKAFLKPGAESRIFVTTPWGAFDVGHPPPKNNYGHERDPRGHVRAMTPRDVVDVAHDADLFVRNLYKEAVPTNTLGDGLHAELAGEASWDGVLDLRLIEPTVFVVPAALWDWNSSSVHRDGMGASEETIVYLAKRLAKATAYPIEVFGPVPNGEPEVHEGVAYWPKEQLRHLVPEQRVVISRSPLYGQYLDKMLGRKQSKVLWLQDAIYPELNAEIAEAYETIVVVSEWHKQAMHERHGVPLEKMVVAYNFLLPEHFQIADAPERKPDHFVFASSPDRGIVRLLECWPEILQRLPNATLDIYYGWRGCEILGKGPSGDEWTRRFEMHRKRFETLKHQQGVRHFGMVDHHTIAKAYMRAGVWAYHNNFEETGCLSACKARAAGAVPVVAPIAALNETAKCEQAFFVPLHDTQGFIDACVEATKVSADERKKMSEQAIKEYSLEAILPVWKSILSREVP